MLNHLAMPAKILIAFLERRRGEGLVKVAKEAGARGGTLAFAQSLAPNRILQALALADVQQDAVFIVMGAEAGEVTAAMRDAAAKDPKRLSGTALLLSVPEMYLRKDDLNRSEAWPGHETRSMRMESGYKLITVIVNSGYAADVMAAARRAGATGGSIISARGTGTEDDVKFFGITLVPEKEMLMVVATADKVGPIVEAIGGVETLNEPGGGVIFTMNVEEFILLGDQKTWVDGKEK